MMTKKKFKFNHKRYREGVIRYVLGIMSIIIYEE